MQHKYSIFSRKSLRTICIVVGSVSAAFILGIETAGDVQPVVSRTEAGGTVLEGDFNGNGVLDVNDARIALELAKGYRSPTPQELSADPNGDFSITFEDAMLILDKLERLPSQPSVQL
jgi:hypothetical protein